MQVHANGSRDGSDEQTILMGMICDRQVVGRMAQIYETHMFASKWGNLISKWCVTYYRKHDRPPMRDIEAYFQKWSASAQDEATVKLVWDFLKHLSGQYETAKHEINADHIIGIAKEYLARVGMRRITRAANHYIDSGQSERASKAMLSYRPIELSDLGAVDFYQDVENLKAAFEAKEDTLIEYEGALGEFFGTSLARGNFISLESPEKRGKSFMLLDIAHRAVEQRRRVAFFDAGDMGPRRVTQRFAVRAAGVPLKPGLLKLPVRMTSTGTGLLDIPELAYRNHKFEYGLSFEQAEKTFKDFQTYKVKSENPYMKVLFQPSGTLKISMVKQALEMWDQEGWTADICVIDYSDILDSDTPSADERDRINGIWIAMRALSQERNMLLVTASQTDANSYGNKKITMANFTGDKRKRSHTDGTFAINKPQSDDSSKQDLSHLDWVVLRDEPRAGVWVAECKALANMCALSCH